MKTDENALFERIPKITAKHWSERQWPTSRTLPAPSASFLELGSDSCHAVCELTWVPYVQYRHTVSQWYNLLVLYYHLNFYRPHPFTWHQTAIWGRKPFLEIVYTDLTPNMRKKQTQKNHTHHDTLAHKLKSCAGLGTQTEEARKAEEQPPFSTNMLTYTKAASYHYTSAEITVINMSTAGGEETRTAHFWRRATEWLRAD